MAWIWRYENADGGEAHRSVDLAAVFEQRHLMDAGVEQLAPRLADEALGVGLTRERLRLRRALRVHGRAGRPLGPRGELPLPRGLFLWHCQTWAGAGEDRLDATAFRTLGRAGIEPAT